MRILFLNPPYIPRFSREQRSPAVTKSGTLYYPMWLGYACGVAEQAGFEVLLLDPPAKGVNLHDTLNRAREFKPQLVVMLTSTPSFHNDKEVAAAFKEAFPESAIGLVGTHASALPRECLQEAPAVDFVAYREYDNTIREVAERLAGNQSLVDCPGLWYRSDGELVENPPRSFITDLDSLPFVSRIYKRFLDIDDYFYSTTRHPMLTIITGRGCPFNCSYCVYPQTMHGRGYRFRSADSVVEEFDYIEKSFPSLKEVFIEDDTFTVNRKRCREIAEKLNAKQSKVVFTANSRCDVDYETLASLKSAGLRLLCVGVESGTQSILDDIDKGITLDQIRTFFDAAKKAGVMVHGCFMVGNKGETRDTMHRTLEFAKELEPDTAQFFPLMVYPGTRAYTWAKENNYLVTTDFSRWCSDEGLHHSLVTTPDLNHQQLVDFCDFARQDFYLRPKYVWRKFVQSLTDFDEFKRNFMSARIFSRYLFRKLVSLSRSFRTTENSNNRDSTC